MIGVFYNLCMGIRTAEMILCYLNVLLAPTLDAWGPIACLTSHILAAVWLLTSSAGKIDQSDFDGSIIFLF